MSHATNSRSAIVRKLPLRSRACPSYAWRQHEGGVGVYARPSRVRVGLFLVACCAELIGEGLPLVHAQSVAKSNVKLAWHAPSECMSEQSAERNLRALIGEPSAQAPAAAVSVEISARAEGYLAQVAFSGAVLGTRELTGTRCDSLSDAAILIVAITAAPEAVAERMSPKREPASASDAALQWRAGLTLRANMVGPLPALSPGVGLDLGFSAARLNLGLTAGYFWPQAQLSGPRPGVGAELALWDLGLRGGVDLVLTRDVGFGPTASVVAGVVSAAPHHLRLPNEDQHAPWLAGALGLQLRRLIAPLLLQAGAELGWCVVQPVFRIEGYEPPVFQSSPWFVRLWFGVAWTNA